MGLLGRQPKISGIRTPPRSNVAEVIILYPGFHVLVTHKIAHFLYNHKCFFLARFVSQLARHLTGIEIHPGREDPAASCLSTTAWASCLARPPRSVTTARSTTA